MNASLFSSYATYVNSVAKRDVRVLVYGGQGPVNFNTMTLVNNARNVSDNFH